MEATQNLLLSVRGKWMTPNTAEPVRPCRRHCQALNWSHVTAATETSSEVDGLVRLKCRRKLINYLIKVK